MHCLRKLEKRGVCHLSKPTGHQYAPVKKPSACRPLRDPPKRSQGARLSTWWTMRWMKCLSFYVYWGRFSGIWKASHPHLSPTFISRWTTFKPLRTWSGLANVLSIGVILQHGKNPAIDALKRLHLFARLLLDFPFRCLTPPASSPSSPNKAKSIRKIWLKKFFFPPYFRYSFDFNFRLGLKKIPFHPTSHSALNRSHFLPWGINFYYKSHPEKNDLKSTRRKSSLKRAALFFPTHARVSYRNARTLLHAKHHPDDKPTLHFLSPPFLLLLLFLGTPWSVWEEEGQTPDPTPGRRLSWVSQARRRSDVWLLLDLLMERLGWQASGKRLLLHWELLHAEHYHSIGVSKHFSLT